MPETKTNDAALTEEISEIAAVKAEPVPDTAAAADAVIEAAAETVEEKPKPAKKAPAKKAAKKAEPQAEEKSEEKPAAKKPSAKKPKAVKLTTKVQYSFFEYDVDYITETVKADYAAKNTKPMKTLAIYIKPEDNKAYYVVNDDYRDSVDI